MDMDLTATPVDNGNIVHRIVRNKLDCEDPFRAVKQASNRGCLDVLPLHRRTVTQSDNPLLESLRLAAAANAIDIGPSFEHDYDVSGTLEKILEGAFDFGDYPLFREHLDTTNHVLYLADNAGEIVFDRLVVEQLTSLGKRVTFVVRSGPILNDATMEDANIAGIQELAEVIPNGQRGPGTSLRLASPTFADRLRSADLILAKGQGNYEGLAGEQMRIFFLFRVKCRLVARHTHAPMGTIVLRSATAPIDQGQAQHQPSATKQDAAPQRKGIS